MPKIKYSHLYANKIYKIAFLGFVIHYLWKSMKKI